MTQLDICNLALARIGERQQITGTNGNIDTTVDGSAASNLCALLYPQTVNDLLSRAWWSWATHEGPLDQISGDNGRYGWTYAYSLPSDCIEPRYIRAFGRPTQPTVPLPTTSASAARTTLAINGRVQQPPFQVIAGSFYSDTFIPPEWTTSTAGAVGDLVRRTTAGNKYYVCIQAHAAFQDPSASNSAYWSETDLQPSLVYTTNINGSGTMPAAFIDVLAMKLAAELALSLATKPELAAALAQQAEMALQRALAAEGNAQELDPIPDSSFITVRG